MDSAKGKSPGIKTAQSPDELESNALVTAVMGLLCAAALVYLFVPFFSDFVSKPDFSGLDIPDNAYVSNNFTVKENGGFFVVPCGSRIKAEVYMRQINSVDKLWRGHNARVLVEDSSSFAAKAENVSARWSDTIHNKSVVRDTVCPKLEAEFTVDKRHVGKWLNVCALMDVVYPVKAGGSYDNRTEHMSSEFKVYVISLDDFRRESYINWMLFYKCRPAYFVAAAALFAFMFICFYRALRSFKKSKALREQQEAIQGRRAS